MRLHFGHACLLLFFSLIPYSRSEICEPFNTPELICIVNYVDKMHCTWFKEEDLGDGPFSLQVENDLGDDSPEIYKCNLVAKPDVEKSYNCTISVKDFSEMDYYNIYLLFPMTVNDTINRKLLINDFSPCCNIKYDPPYNLKSNITNDTSIILWEMNGSFIEHLRYELQFKKKNIPWQKAKHKQMNSSEVHVEINLSELEKDSAYVARLRRKTRDNIEQYRSQWSEWSKELLFHTPSKGI
ncbi:interleukin-9 receptor-like [Discoglossus pictus]